MKKIILLVIFVFLCFGCEARYNITINEDLTVEESIVGLEDEAFYNKYNKSTKDRIMDFVIATKEEYLNKNDFDKEKVIEEKLTGLRVSKKYNSIDEYFEKSIAYEQFYENFKHEIKGDIITINLDEKLDKNGNSLNRYVVDKGEVSLILPFKVVKHNADKVENKTYIWSVNSSNDKNINISFDISKKAGEHKLATYLIIATILFALVLVMLFVRNKRKNSNRF